ncbi:DUF4123 domain-containing protein [Fulvimonas sp. R45]|uniref:DUF4123 domain-containing protein n=1 Tax=Fulvimonas sp. R45 TaxID=3045937 RepID=UPI0026601330|nr:DUF4123 domain-containing protein [Fulvimonas sp. R45]MDO1530631.1 DUF4123 domain-containing protein [Fulvimonas sp. R45]
MSALDHRLIQSHDYAIVNPLQVDISLWGDLDAKATVPRTFKDQPELFPLLIDLNALPFARRIALIEQSEAWAQNHDQPMLSALLKSDAPRDRVVQHLARAMHVRRDGRDRVFRFHDPRVFQHLQWLFDSAQMKALLGPLDTWTWRAPSGDWSSWAAPGAAATALRIRADQWPILLRMEDINMVLATLADAVPSLAVEEKLVRRIDGLLAESAQDWGMAAPDDRQLFACQAIRFHPRIHAHPALKTRLATVRDGTQSYVGACADLDDAVMLQLVAEIAPDYKDDP